MAGKTVLITGSTRGIGLEFVQHYTKTGWNVIAGARDPSKADKLKTLSPHKIVQLDTADEGSITRAAQELQDVPINLLINNAGILSRNGVDSTTKADLMQQFEVNAVGPFLVTRAFLPNLKLAAATNDSIAKVAQLSSQMGSIAHNTSGGCVGYRVSKAAVNMINSCLANELKSEKITLIVVHPGYVATDMNNYSGTIQTQDSVAGITKVLEEITLDDSGKFYQYDGSTLPW